MTYGLMNQDGYKGKDIMTKHKAKSNKKTVEQKAINDFEYMRYSAEARAYSKLSLERPLTTNEFNRYKDVCKKIGIMV